MTGNSVNLVESKAKLLLFQLGPVHDFIGQARSTRDLWSGSYLVSWMMAEVAVRLEKMGAELVFPSNRENYKPLIEWIGRGCDLPAPRNVLIPNIPNRLLAVVPNEFEAAEFDEILSEVFSYNPASCEATPISRWEIISQACWEYFAEQSKPLDSKCRPLWDEQLSRFWQVSWQISRFRPFEEISGELASIPLGRGLLETQTAASPASLEWMANFLSASHKLDARRQTRDFGAWQGKPGIDKDSHSGKEESLISREWLAGLPENGTLRHLFRKNDLLGAPNLVRRVWHRAFLQHEKHLNLSHDLFYYPSVPGIAAFPWGTRVMNSLREHPKLHRFAEAVWDARSEFDFEPPQLRQGESHDAWLTRVDWAIYQESFWEKLASDLRGVDQSTEKADAALDCLRHLKVGEDGTRILGDPNGYYAVLALDGDGMGRWLSGEKLIGEFGAERLGRSFHEQFSAGLAETALEQVQSVVEDPGQDGASDTSFQGKVIYAGGDDVLAVLPAAQAIGCAVEIRKRFAELMRVKLADVGIDGLKFTASAGIAIGHIKAPLQDMVEAAQVAERRSKKAPYGGDAICISLFKRSGSQVLWGANIESPSLELLQFIQGNDSSDRPRFRKLIGRVDVAGGQPPISGRFPYRVAELLEPYQGYIEGDRSRPEPMTSDLVEIAMGEMEFLVSRQCKEMDEVEKQALLVLCRRCLEDLFEKERPLSDFFHLFAIEAFIQQREQH